ncbi:putative membrane protein [Rhodopirellula maiorica SM1]|uniref:Putative membrane protein n=2 Tax=Novipirellula TaxID=2795426 RepID=M5RM77_9BACT|nr:putative membrane protein [Rhodopirellula maiorica SM1]
MLLALPLVMLPVIIHWMNQRRHQTKAWGAMAFLMQASQMSRGYAKLRRWLILALRVLVVAGLIFAVTRPLSSGLLGWRLGGHVDTTIVILDRSPSMQETGKSGESKLSRARKQIASTLGMLDASHWVLIDSGTQQPTSFETLGAMVDSPLMRGSSSTAKMPKLIQTAVDYLKRNQVGDADVWICSDLRTADWDMSSHQWTASREMLTQMPQSIRFHLLAYPESNPSNRSVRVSEARRIQDEDGDAVLISLDLSQFADQATGDQGTGDQGKGDQGNRIAVPVQVEVDGVRTQFDVSLVRSQSETRSQRIPIASQSESGWGRLAIPADANNADNVSYFVFDAPPPRRVVLVSDDRDATKALEIAAAVSPDPNHAANVDVLTSDSLDSLDLDATALVLWCVELPDGTAAQKVTDYVDQGGQVIFFPPPSLWAGGGVVNQRNFSGIQWGQWQGDGEKVLVENWRSDQDLLAATSSGAGLPVGQLQVHGHATVKGDVTPLATVTGGDPLLARLMTDNGGVYFCAASPSLDRSSLADNGVVLYAIVQRAIDQGLQSLTRTRDQVAGQIDLPTNAWKQLAGDPNGISSEYASSAGVYRSGAGQGGRLIAVNRAAVEDQVDTAEAAQVEALFEGVRFSRIDEDVDDTSGIAREVWRLFLLGMIIAMLLEAVLCLPRRSAKIASQGGPA